MGWLGGTSRCLRFNYRGTGNSEGSAGRRGTKPGRVLGDLARPGRTGLSATTWLPRSTFSTSHLGIGLPLLPGRLQLWLFAARRCRQTSYAL